MAEFESLKRKPPGSKKILLGRNCGIPADLQEICNDNLAKLILNLREDVNMHGKEWHLEIDDETINAKVYNSVEDGSNLRRMKGTCLLENAFTTDVIEFVNDAHNRCTFDSTMESVEYKPLYSEKKEDASHEVTLTHFRTTKVGPVTSRDFVDINFQIKSDDRKGDCYSAGGSSNKLTSYIARNHGNDYPESPETCIRGSTGEGCGWKFEQRGDDVLFTYVAIVDLQGWFLPVIVNSVIAGTLVTFFTDLKSAWSEYIDSNKGDNKYNGSRYIDASNSPQSHKPFS